MKIVPGLVDADDPEAIAFFKHDVATVLVSGRADHPLADTVAKTLAANHLGLLIIVGNDAGQCAWALFLLLRGGRLANLAWGPNAAPGDLIRRVVDDEELEYAEVVYGPITGGIIPAWAQDVE